MIAVALDAATYSGSVALIRDGTVAGDATAAMRGKDEERLMPALAALLERHAVPPRAIEAVACGAGPGSFTSLRIAAAIAKGLAAARAIPLLVAPSPLLVIAGAWPALPPGRYIAALDAMRGDCFCQEVEVADTGELRPGPAWRSSRAEAVTRAAELNATLAGPMESVSREPLARGFAVLIAQGLVTNTDLVSWEPDYGRKAEAQVRWEAAHGRPLPRQP